MKVYVDTSALVKLLVDEPESDSLISWLDGAGADLVSSELLEVELRRVAIRAGVRLDEVARLVEGVSLAGLDRAVVRGAGLLPMAYLRTLDALHLESALRLGVSHILTYDRRMMDAARVLGLESVSPA